MTERRFFCELWGTAAVLCAFQTVAIQAGCNPAKATVLAWAAACVAVPLLFWRWSRMPK